MKGRPFYGLCVARVSVAGPALKGDYLTFSLAPKNSCLSTKKHCSLIISLVLTDSSSSSRTDEKICQNILES